MSDPNFPPDLSINPSWDPFSLGDRREFNVSSQQNAIQKYGIAGRVWEASYTLARYLKNELEFDPPSPFSTRDASNRKGIFAVLELGSGTGVVAADLCQVLSHQQDSLHMIIATDLENVCPLLEENLVQGKENPVELLVRPLAWGNYEHTLRISEELSQRERRLTHIICSDLVYFPELLAPLLRSLIHLTSSQCDQPIVIISYKIRSLPKESPFWSAFGLWFEWSPVLYREGVADSSSSTTTNPFPKPWTRYHSPSSTYVFVAHRKPESHSWSVAESDSDLLGGVGANGDNSKKADEEFEVMLLMDLIEI